MSEDLNRSAGRLNEVAFYDAWIARQEIPVLKDFYLSDIRTVELHPWPWKGGKGVYLNLIGTEDTDDAYICEIPPGGKLEPQRHLYEELIYVVSGRGATTVWQDEAQRQTFEWQTGSLFSVPLNVSHQHFNGSGMEPARYFAVTNAPMVLNLFHNEEFLFRNPFAFKDRYEPRPDYFSGKGKLYDFFGGGKLYENGILDTNFVSDVRTFKLLDCESRGYSSSFICFELADNTMAAHIAEFPVGTYKKAHRHGPGAHVVILSGKGYSLMWAEGEEMRRFDWQEGSVVVPPNMWFHQHFNAGGEPARYLALRWNSRKHPFGKQFALDLDVKQGGDQIEYRNEDPKVRKMFEDELAKGGIESKMARLFGGF